MSDDAPAVEPRRLLVAGDSHANPAHLRFLVERAAEQRCDAVLHLGDLGFWPRADGGRRFLLLARQELSRASLPLYFIDGNHEDYPALQALEQAEGELFRRALPPEQTGGAGVWHIPRGTRWTWHGVSFLGVGGGYSLDKELREADVDWFADETLRDDEVTAILAEPGAVDVCAFHDAPAGVELPIEFHPILDAEWHRERLAEIADHVRPALILHAHYHSAYQDRYESEDSGFSAPVIGLDCDLNPKRSWLVLDLDDVPGLLPGWRAGEAARLPNAPLPR